MDLSNQMRIIYNVKYGYEISLKFGDKLFTILTRLMHKTKSSIRSTIRENLLLYCRKFSTFVVVVIIYHHKETPLAIETIIFSIESLVF